ncbi:DUF1254 domain-containing protein [Pseudomonas sp.]|uniref:DUF1254 domain-containing protein n=1 Tax=Pseudomonas sp. TaxID=306 RepID=UPI00257952FC|nr:DUF1254 domain-containing protein [Pseudomonas sp.]
MNTSEKLQKRPSVRNWLWVGLVVLLIVGGTLWSQMSTVRLAAKSYVFGYPLVLTELTRNSFTHSIAPANRLVNMAEFPEADFRVFVRPNIDTLYTQAWLDMEAGPWVFEVPASSRYLVMQFLDAWSNVFASVGTRTTGDEGGRFLLAGSDWDGQVPEGMTLLRSSTRMNWLLGRIQTNGKADYSAVHAIQAGLSLRSLDDWKQDKVVEALPFKLPEQLPPSPLFEMRKLAPRAFFGQLSRLMEDNPAAATDAAAVAELEQLGVRVGEGEPRWNWLQEKTVAVGMWLAEREMHEALERRDLLVNGWRQAPKHIAAFGQDYGVRAVVAMVGFGANLAAEATYLNAITDAHGEVLQGDQRYRLHFAADQLPPAKAFWSLTAYDDDGYLIPNPLHRFALGDRDKLVYNPDGSLNLLMQSEAPGEEQLSNWLPTPNSGPFSITGRIYLPTQRMLDGQWQMPGIERL